MIFDPPVIPEPVSDLYNRLSQTCYAIAGGDRLSDGRVSIWRRVASRAECGPWPRLIVKVNQDGSAYIWWAQEDKK